MKSKPYPVIDLAATGKNILSLRKERGLSIRDLQVYFGFAEPQAIYKWQRGTSLPSVDNLYALSILLDVSVNDILIPVGAGTETERQSGDNRSVTWMILSFFSTAVLKPAETENRHPDCIVQPGCFRH